MSAPWVDGPDEQEDPADSGPVQSGQPKLRILLADDCVAARVLTSALIRRMGFDVHTVANGEEALNAAHQTAYDMVILDIDMPVMDGMSTARDLRTIRDLGGKTLIVAMSGFLNEFSAAADWQELFDATITKPVSKHQLTNAIIGLLPASRAFTRASAADERYRDSPLLNSTILELKRSKIEDEAWFALITDTTRQLREIATNLDRAIATDDKAFLSQVKASIEGLPLVSAAPQLVRRAAAFDIAANSLPASALAAPAQRLIGCALSTIVLLKKQLDMPCKPA